MEEALANGAKFPDRDFLKSLGITKKVALRLLANGKSETFLNTKVTARVYLVHQANSAEEIMMAQRKANLLAKDRDVTDVRTKAACLAVVAQCAMALARLSEVALATARNLDQPEDEGTKPKITPIQNNFFGFPPVAPNPRKGLESSARSGDEDLEAQVVDVKASK